jgi:nitroreductase
MKNLLTRALMIVALTGVTMADQINLPTPSKEGGKPLMTALSERKTSREFSDREIPLQMLSDMLWAAYGINRPDGRLTSPTAINRQEIDLYLVMKNGAYFYNPKELKLAKISEKDIRTTSGFGKFAEKAPLTIIFVVNKGRQQISDPTASLTLGAVDCGFIGQNLYLYCASEGLNTVFFATLNKEALSTALKLEKGNEVFFGQSIGFPPEK